MYRGGGHTGQVGSDTKDGFKARLLREGLVLETVVDVQRVGEDDGLGLRDALAVVEVAHQLHEVPRVARVLAHAAEYLRVCLARWLATAVRQLERDRRVHRRRLDLGLAGRVGFDRRGGPRGRRGHGAHAGRRVVGDLLAEGVEEDGSAEGVGQRDPEDL
ncbi:hypothetical protein VTN02DRAFT_6240 [Thermoascus thermophilus]